MSQARCLVTIFAFADPACLVQTDNFQASCDVPTVYAIHGIDYEHDAGVAGAGMIAEFNHCVRQK